MAPSAPHPAAHEAAVAAAGGLDGAVPARDPALLRVRDYARTTLQPRHRAVVRAFAETLFARDDGPPDQARLDGFPAEVDAMISNASKTLRFGLCVMLDIMRWAPLFLMGKLAVFEDLDLASRTKVLEKMDRGPALQLVFVAYKTVVTMLYLETPEELRATGYSSVRRRYTRALPQLTDHQG